MIFDPNSDHLGERFHVGVTLESNVQAGRHPDPGTIMWWMGEDRAAARKALMEMERVDLFDALDGLARWAPDTKTCVWGNGAAFDNVILAGAYKDLQIEPFWRYRQDRCYRTLTMLAPDIPWDGTGLTHHSALDDAVGQARHLQKIVKHLGLVV